MGLNGSSASCIILLLAFVMLLSGCLTMHNLEVYEPKIYGGVRINPRDAFYDDFYNTSPAIMLWIYMIDWPLSLVADTITLPYVIIYNLTKPQLPRKK